MKNNIQNNATRFLTIGENELIFQFIQDNESNKEIILPVGYQSLVESFFKRDIPSESETEYAINYIEDELMSNTELQNNHANLYSADKNIINIFRKNGIDTDSLSRRSIEDLFSQYARVVMGAPASELQTKITREDFATVLVLREIMHHLDFEALTLSE